MERSRLRQLLTDYSTGTISETDLEILLDYVAGHQHDANLDSLLEELLEETDAAADLPIDAETLYQRIVDHSAFSRPRRFSKKYWNYGAAAVLLLLGGWLLSKKDPISNNGVLPDSTATLTHTVTSSPSDKPILRLADGRTIDLDDAANGLLAVEGETQIKFDGATLHYEGELPDANGKLLTNTIVTPKGRQYQLVLPDGSKIWLNAATEFTYPVQFNKSRREVTINGEAYFEVEKAADWPFIVKTKSQEVEVLGTHFNVSAYEDDEQAKTTLVEGSVKVSSIAVGSAPAQITNRSIILTPGQQAVTKRGKSQIVVGSIDTEEVISWKENLFVFYDEEISEVMKKVSRWYDVEVTYLDGMAGKRIGGSIPRFASIGELMDALQATGLLHYKLEGGIVVIMK
ncbi:FecR family protein [Parapedobacter koreensis]|uniref:FecR family protein n=1 Tax=Parapedobacter koreensis TaxID=332977 RepID=A0A1H7TE16_9SPHI|nr:FecR domain-containing protein [Parapedobacter koreensis]SEL83122.1 FecR family protein [Parapedobacter koreensis]